MLLQVCPRPQHSLRQVDRLLVVGLARHLHPLSSVELLPPLLTVLRLLRLEVTVLRLLPREVMVLLRLLLAANTARPRQAVSSAVLHKEHPVANTALLPVVNTALLPAAR